MKIVLELPDNCNPELSANLAELASTLRRLTDDAAKSATFEDAEIAIAQVCGRVEATAVGSVLAALDCTMPLIEVDGTRYRNLGAAPKTYRTLAGEVTVVRHLFRAAGVRNGPTLDPVAVRAGAVGDGWLPGAARAMALHIGLVTSRESAKLAQSTRRLPYSRSSFERVGHLVGDELVARGRNVDLAIAERFAVPDDAASVSISLDRVSVPMEEIAANGEEVVRAYRMAHCGAITLHNADGEALDVRRYGRMPHGDVDGLDETMQADLHALLALRPKLDVVVLADGADEMWTRLDRIVDDLDRPPTRILDFWHLCEYLSEAAQVLPTGVAADDQLGRWKHRLCNSNHAIALLEAELKPHRQLDAVANALRYIDNHRDRLHYAQARARGFPIGSGNVEATCKTLVSQRFKRAGSRWKADTGEHVLQLRVLALGDHWSTAMEVTLAPLRRRVEELAA